MTKHYDLVIVGAGPAGAMAAKTAGENGLKTAILERKTDPARITRGCAHMFISEAGAFAEKMYYNSKSRKMIFPVNGFTVDYDGPVRNFYAWHVYSPDGKTRLEFGDYEQNIKQGDRGRISFVFDKGRLIEGLMKEAVKNGVDVFAGVNAEGVEKTSGGVTVTGSGETFEGSFVIGADGLNSRTAQQMGFNKGRKFYGNPPGINYYVKGLSIPQSEALTTPIYFRPNAPVPGFFYIIPSPFAEDEFWIGIRTREDFEYATTKSVYSEWFHNHEITGIKSYVWSQWAPVDEPFRDNVLLAGDAPWYAESEITGAMMCGWKSANAVTVALKNGKPDREGILSYIEWWRKSFPEYEDYRKQLLLFPFYLMFTQEEMIYLYRLINKPLPKTMSPFKPPELFKEALKPMMDRIREEMPAAAEKIDRLSIDNVEELLSDIKKKNYKI